MTEKGDRKVAFFSVQYSIMKATLHNSSSPKRKKEKKPAKLPRRVEITHLRVT